MYVIIVGGGKVGYYLSKELMNQDYELLLMEKDRNRLAFLQSELGEVAFHGDGAEIQYMEAAGFRRADVVVAVTGDDEDNLVVCQVAKWHFNVPRVLARVNDPANQPIFQKLGVAETVNSTRLIYNLLEQSIETDEVVPLAALQKGDIEIVEVHVGPKSKVAGKRIDALDLPDRSLIITMLRNGEARIPQADTVLAVDDTLVAIVEEAQEEKLAAVFA
ncbi:MAG: TrkA family potassium uptake protein [Armatimonadetes bacterium]|nr:TrkA family potassium uptake protein [Armatimonadota bacterium]